MKIIKPMVFRSVADENMLVPVGESVKTYNGIFTLTKVGADIWLAIERGLSKEEISKELAKKYDVEYAVALSDVKEFIAKLKKFEIIAD